MKLSSIRLQNFRNIRKADFEPGESFNIFFGCNAQGKTNLLESIYLLATLKSFRHARNRELINWDSPRASVSGVLEKDGVFRDIELVLCGEGRKVRLDGKSLNRLSDFFGTLNMVVFSPDELTMVRGMPEGRRRYLDRAVFSGDPGYLLIHHEYAKILRHRNALLRTGEDGQLDAWTERLAHAAVELGRRRIAFIDGIREGVQAFYRQISGSDAEARLSYHTPRLDPAGIASGDVCHVIDALRKSAIEERRRGMTLLGPHRDDIEFLLNGRPLKLNGSQGEQRSFVLALKMAEIAHIRRRFGMAPILLLDDITSELDEHRNRNFMEFLSTHSMQVFITTTDLANIRLASLAGCRTFRLEGGQIFCSEVS